MHGIHAHVRGVPVPHLAGVPGRDDGVVAGVPRDGIPVPAAVHTTPRRRGARRDRAPRAVGEGRRRATHGLGQASLGDGCGGCGQGQGVLRLGWWRHHTGCRRGRQAVTCARHEPACLPHIGVRRAALEASTAAPSREGGAWPAWWARAAPHRERPLGSFVSTGTSSVRCIAAPRRPLAHPRRVEPHGRERVHHRLVQRPAQHDLRLVRPHLQHRVRRVQRARQRPRP
mmetsp:Transcript_21711/g.73807  ORF Transcript_21711/g.73807 Transcript_21711/m.73807 type:complete len:228 (-) Transcript_21711:1574-2257(-)